MPLYAKSEDWLHQSSLLLEARPETTRITTRYTIRRPKTKKPSPTDAATPAQPAARGDLELKTYDPASGVALRYRTVKLAEVGRLMQLLGGQLARRQAGVPAVDEEVLPDAPSLLVAVAGEGGAGAAPAAPAAAASGGGGGAAGGGGGKGKKKKGKR